MPQILENIGTFAVSLRNCTPVDPNYYYAEPISRSWTLHKIMTVTGAPLAILTALTCFWIAARHLANYTNPHVQRQMVRAAVTPFAFSVCAFFGLWFYDASEYLVPVAHLYECFALVAFFYYMIMVAAPDPDSRVEFFHNLERRGRGGKVIPGGSLKWFANRWIMVFQLLPGRFIATIATWIVVSTFCETKRGYKLALTIINAINGVQTIICIAGMIQTYRRLREFFIGHNVARKFLTLKLVVVTQVVQRAVFSGLVQFDVVDSSTHISHMDWSHGIPEFIAVCEMFLFCFLFIVPYSPKPFKAGASECEGGKSVEAVPFWRALLNALNIGDILYGLVYPFKVRRMARRARKEAEMKHASPQQRQ